MENVDVSLYGRSKLYERDRNKYYVGGTVPRVTQGLFMGYGLQRNEVKFTIITRQLRL